MASADQVRRRIANLTFGLERSGLATEEELASVAARFQGESDVEKLWEYWAELKALGIARIGERKKKGPVNEQQLEVAAEALAEKPEKVELPSLKKTITVHPASYARIQRIEEHAFWMSMLEAARSLLLDRARTGQPSPATSGKPCGECGRPTEPGRLEDLLDRTRTELKLQRAALYGQVTAPGPAPSQESVDWAEKITPLEEALLMQAYHRVNYDVIQGLPEPKSKDGERDLPRSWAFLFSSMALREKKPAAEIMQDRSLASIIATFVLEQLREEEREAKRKKEKEKVR